MLLIARQQIACALFACLVISLSQALDHGLKFKSISDYIGHLKTVSTLPKGFSVGATRFMFSPMEVNKQLPMNLTIIKLDQPTDSFAAMFTSNKFPGGPVVVGKERLLKSKQLQAVVINNKISNVCPGGVSDRGVGDSEEVCQAVADKLQLKSKDLVFPSSTGIIGWRLPVQAIKDAVVCINIFSMTDTHTQTQTHTYVLSAHTNLFIIASCCGSDANALCSSCSTWNYYDGQVPESEVCDV